MNKIILSVVTVALLTFTAYDGFAQKTTKKKVSKKELKQTETPAGEKEVAWRSFEEVDKLMKINPKPILIDMYTSWCGWCKVMDKKTYSQQPVIDYINQHFYAVKFDAESKAPVTFNGKTFESSGKTHQIAIELMSGRLSYPTTIVMEADRKSVSPIPGYLQPSQMETILKYLMEGRDKNITWQDWQTTFKPTWKDPK